MNWYEEGIEVSDALRELIPIKYKILVTYFGRIFLITGLILGFILGFCIFLCIFSLLSM